MDVNLLRHGIRRQSAGDISGAETDYRTALAVNPESADAQFLLGSLLGENERLDDAEQHLRQALSTRPGFADAQGATNAIGQVGLPVQGQCAQVKHLEVAVIIPRDNTPLLVVVGVAWNGVNRALTVRQELSNQKKRPSNHAYAAPLPERCQQRDPAGGCPRP